MLKSILLITAVGLIGCGRKGEVDKTFREPLGKMPAVFLLAVGGSVGGFGMAEGGSGMSIVRI